MEVVAAVEKPSGSGLEDTAIEEVLTHTGIAVGQVRFSTGLIAFVLMVL